MSIAKSTQYLLETKNLIRNAINEKGRNILPTDTFRSYVNEINNIVVGEGGTGKTKLDYTKPIVQFHYLDPTTGEDVLVEQNVEIGGTAIPPVAGNVQATSENPSLIFPGWNFTNEEMSNVEHDLDIGAMYDTEDGKTYFYMEITTKTGSTAILALTTAFYISASLSPTSIMTIDWGDGTTTTKSNANVSVHEHTYADYGRFVVTFSINDDTKYTIGNGYVNSAVVGGTNNYLRTALKKCFVGRNATVNNYAFNSCSYLDKITLGNTTNSSGNSFLSACKNLKYVVVPRSMTSLSSGLGSCYNLEFISLHPDVTEADYIATSNYKLKSLIYHRKIKTIVNTGGIHSLERLVVPFLGRTSTDSTTNYISYLFGNHDTSGGMEDDNTKYVPSTLKKITIMDGSNIRASAFKGCTNLIISIVNDAKLPSYAFANINNLVTVTFPKTITSLSSYLFQNTFGLKEIALPNSVTTSTSTLFQGCQNLEKVIVSKNSKNYSSSFSNCVALKIVIFDIDIPPTIGSLDFQTSFNVKIYVPDANVDAYKVATNWVLFANSIYPISALNEEDKQWLSEQNG